jgi:aspartate/methionine/tyrosine aminotransferase
MPKINRSLEQVGIGFAAFLAPPGPEVIRFTVGQPDFDTPAPIVDAVKAALDRGETAYTRTQGSVELCDAVAQHLTVHDIKIDPEDVVVTPDASKPYSMGMMATLDV